MAAVGVVDTAGVHHVIGVTRAAMLAVRKGILHETVQTGADRVMDKEEVVVMAAAVADHTEVVPGPVLALGHHLPEDDTVAAGVAAHLPRNRGKRVNFYSSSTPRYEQYRMVLADG